MVRQKEEHLLLYGVIKTVSCPKTKGHSMWIKSYFYGRDREMRLKIGTPVKLHFVVVIVVDAIPL